MIIECPNCHSRFKINPAALGSSGRELLCSKCRHVWHQDPLKTDDFSSQAIADEEAAQRNDLKRAQDIVSSLRETPIQNEKPDEVQIKQNANDDDFNRAFADILKEADIKTQPTASAPEQVIHQSVIEGVSQSKINEMKRMPYLVFLMLTLITFMFLIIGREKIVSVWHPSAGLFQLVGIPTEVFGKDFVFSEFSARIETFGERPALILSGALENKSREKIAYPAFKITFYNQAKTKVLLTRELRADDIPFEPAEKRPFKLGIESFPKEVSVIVIEIKDPQKLQKEKSAP